MLTNTEKDYHLLFCIHFPQWGDDRELVELWSIPRKHIIERLQTLTTSITNYYLEVRGVRIGWSGVVRFHKPLRVRDTCIGIFCLYWFCLPTKQHDIATLLSIPCGVDMQLSFSILRFLLARMTVLLMRQYQKNIS